MIVFQEELVISILNYWENGFDTKFVEISNMNIKTLCDRFKQGTIYRNAQFRYAYCVLHTVGGM